MKQIILPLILVMFSSQYLAAQTVDEIIEKYIEARGGRARFDSLKSVYLEGSEEDNGYGSQLKITIEQGKLYRADIDWPAGKGIRIITAKEGWFIRTKPKKKITKMSDSALLAKQYKFDIEGGLINYKAKGHKVELVGKDTTTNGIACYKIKFTSNTGTEVMYWLNAKNYLKEQSSITENIHIDDKGSIIIINDTISYKNYKNVSGILFPFSENMTMTEAFTKKKTGSVNIYYRKIEANVPVDPALYDPEKAK